MKKIIFTLTLLFGILIASATYVYAGSLSTFEITGGIDKQKDTETTFDSKRTISGTAEADTEIEITVYSVSGFGDQKKLKEVDSYYTKVGLSKMFSQTINLCVGENLIVIEAQNGDREAEQSVTIKRKKSEIKYVLEQQGIVVPGKDS